MLDKYFFACLVFTVVENAACPDPPQGKVGDISLDYYFGLDDTLRSAKFIENCNWHGAHDSCQKRCGANHACLLGKCFCVDVKPQIKEEAMDDSTITTTTDKGCSKLFARLRVLEELLRQSKRTKKEQKYSSGEDSSLESESEENAPKYSIQLDALGQRPTLRHHIAHFCPNLNIARQCIRKCMELGKPAFCGKDHVCYCGHRYGTPNDDIEASEEFYTPFQDLYEKFFGPKTKQELKLIMNTTSTTSSTTTSATTLQTTTVETSSVSPDSDKEGSDDSNSGNDDSTDEDDDVNERKKQIVHIKGRKGEKTVAKADDVPFTIDPDPIDTIVL